MGMFVCGRSNNFCLFDLQVYLEAKIPLLSRIGFFFQRNFFTRYLDPSFSLDEFLEGAKFSYTIIRHISSNIKDPSRLDLLNGMVDSKLLQVKSCLSAVG